MLARSSPDRTLKTSPHLRPRYLVSAGKYPSPQAVAMLISENPHIFQVDAGANGYYGYEVMDTCRPQSSLKTSPPSAAINREISLAITSALAPGETWDKIHDLLPLKAGMF
jgi:hypothetical protein